MWLEGYHAGVRYRGVAGRVPRRSKYRGVAGRVPHRSKYMRRSPSGLSWASGFKLKGGNFSVSKLCPVSSESTVRLERVVGSLALEVIALEPVCPGSNLGSHVLAVCPQISSKPEVLRLYHGDSNNTVLIGSP